MKTAELIAQTEHAENVRADFQELWLTTLLPRIRSTSKDSHDLALLSDIAWIAYRSARRTANQQP